MKRYHGGEKVYPGFYFNLQEKNLVTVSGCADVLPGEKRDKYVRIPVLFMLAAGPFLGLLYVIFLPFISFVMVGWVAIGKTLGAMAHAARGLRSIAAAGWKPGLAYFTWPWKRKTRPVSEEPGKGSPELEEPLASLERIVMEKRKEEDES